MIDSHCHFDFPNFDKNRVAIWQNCQTLGVQKLIIPGIHEKQWQQAYSLCQEFTGMYSACGLHPFFIRKEEPQNLRKAIIRFVEQHPAVIAIGECGLDKHIEISLDRQIALLRTQITCANELQLPLILHVRGYHNELIQLLKREKPLYGGVIHAFSGSLELAQTYWDLGFYLGVSGTITYPRASKTRNALAAMPLESLLLETDAPDMPLHGQQGHDNSPENLIIIAKCLAELKGIALEEVIQQTSANCNQLFVL